MARTKQTERKASAEEASALAAAARGAARGPRTQSPQQYKRKRTPEKPTETPAMKARKQWKSNALSEIRAAQKAIEMVIPRLPFQRVVRDICRSWSLTVFRWQLLGLHCLQEACEDYLIEMFLDCTVLAAHAHRVTIMPRDLQVLKRMRMKFDPLMEKKVHFTDPKTVEALHIPERQKKEEGGFKAESIKITHDHMTRLTKKKLDILNEHEERMEKLKKQDKKKKKEEDKEKGKKGKPKSDSAVIEETFCKAFEHLGHRFLVHIPDPAGALPFDVGPEDCKILKNKRAQLNDSIVYICLW